MASADEDLFILWLPKTSLACKFPCFVKLPPAMWSCVPLSSVSPFPPCMKDQFQISPMKLPEVENEQVMYPIPPSLSPA